MFKQFCFVLVVVLLFSLPGEAALGKGADRKNNEICQLNQNIDSRDKTEEDDIIQELSMEYQDTGDSRVGDPLQGWNRFWFTFNDRLYFYLLKPVAKNYSRAVPKDFRNGVKNVFSNLRYPVRLVNCVLQAKFKRAAKESAGFVINTLLGLGGLLKPAQEIDWIDDPPSEDTGQTLAVWGVGDGFYLVLPLLGPSTGRDALGKVGDFFLDPMYYVEYGENWHPYALSGYERLNEISLRLGEYEDLKKAAVDPYTALMDAYLQYRQKQIEK